MDTAEHRVVLHEGGPGVEARGKELHVEEWLGLLLLQLGVALPDERCKGGHRRRPARLDALAVGLKVVRSLARAHGLLIRRPPAGTRSTRHAVGCLEGGAVEGGAVEGAAL